MFSMSVEVRKVLWRNKNKLKEKYSLRSIIMRTKEQMEDKEGYDKENIRGALFWKCYIFINHQRANSHLT